jgi:hypothetical protein
MKAISYVSGTPDRIATLEEVYQVMDVLGRIATDQGLAYSPILELSLPVARREASANTKGLWIDISEEDPGAPALESDPEFLAESFADRGDSVN